MLVNLRYAGRSMPGYWANSEESADSIRDGWLYTGDMARKDEDGYFYIVDRKKDLILVGGYSVFPREVEDALVREREGTRSAGGRHPDKHRGEIVTAYVVLKPDIEATEAELRHFAAERLADFKVPLRIEFRESLPKSAVGKYLRRELVRRRWGSTKVILGIASNSSCTSRIRTGRGAHGVYLARPRLFLMVCASMG